MNIINNDIKLYYYEWYCIYENYKYEYFDNPNDKNNDKVLYWVKRTYKGRKSYYKNATIKLFNIKFYNNKLKKTNVKIGVIECIEARDACSGLQAGKYLSTNFVIKDQYDETFEVTFLEYEESNSLPNIIRMIKKMKIVNKKGSIKLYTKYIDAMRKSDNKDWKPR